MDRNLKETAVRNSNEIHENDGSANTRMRAKCPLWARIVLACGAVLLLLVAGVWLLAGLSALSLPGLSTFVSEFMVIAGAWSRNPVVTVVALLGVGGKARRNRDA